MSARDCASWVGLVLIVVGLLVGATNQAVLFPRWDLDAFVSPLPTIGVTPIWRAVLDLVVLAGAASAVFGAARVHGWMVWLWALGAAVCVVHGVGDAEAARMGLTWAAAMGAGVGCAHLVQDPGRRRVLVAVLIGSAALLAAKGAGQIFIEHASTVRSFELDRAVFLAARGWEEGSVSARLFERRLLQPEAGGWFGLANVFASFGAAILVGFAGAAGTVLRGKGERWMLLAGACLACGVMGAAMLLLAGSKGGWGAALGGLVFVGLALLAPKRIGVLAAVGVSVAAVLAVVARGLAPIAEEAELSLLFRWYYMQGAAEVIASHPLLGVSPTGFKDVYLLVKPALSPEQVSSPHSVVFDWAAGLGVAGLAWVALLGGWLLRAGRSVHEQDEAGAPAGRGVELRALLGLVVAVGAAGTFLDAPMATPEGAIVRIAGLAGWFGLGALVLWLPARAVVLLAAGTAVTLAAHAQIEMTPIWINSAGLWAALLGCGCAVAVEPRGQATRGRVIGSGVVAAGAVALGAVVLPVTVAWERALGRAADAAGVSAVIDTGFAEAAVASDAATAHATLRGVASDVGVPAGTSIDATAGRLLAAQTEVVRSAVAGLESAIEADPGHHGTRAVLSRGWIRLGERDEGPAAADALRRAIEVAERGVEARPESARAWAWLGRVRVLAGERGVGEIGDAVAPWERAAALDPGGLVHAVRLMDLHADLGRQAECAAWAGKALELDEQHRLDPLSQLTEAERARAEEAAGGG